MDNFSHQHFREVLFSINHDGLVANKSPFILFLLLCNADFSFGVSFFLLLIYFFYVGLPIGLCETTIFGLIFSKRSTQLINNASKANIPKEKSSPKTNSI